MKLPTPPFGYVIFSDDLRQEAGNKISAMGIYEGEMVFPPGTAFPIAIPRLGIIVRWLEPTENYAKHLVFSVEMDSIDSHGDSGTEQVFAQATVDIPENLSPPPDLGPTIGLNVGQAFLIGPIIVTQPSKVRVVVTRDGEKWGIARLRIPAPLPAPSEATAIVG